MTLSRFLLLLVLALALVGRAHANEATLGSASCVTADDVAPHEARQILKPALCNVLDPDPIGTEAQEAPAHSHVAIALAWALNGVIEFLYGPSWIGMHAY